MSKRIIVKVGTGVISDDAGTIDAEVLMAIVAQIVALRESGAEVVLVSSGAVGAGKSALDEKGKNSPVVQKQLYAAVGQVKLMSKYDELFATHGYICAQVLATKEDFRDATHYDNMKKCFDALLLDGVVPVVNENDVVATEELMFTDNDELAALVAVQLDIDTLIILTSTDGILDGSGKTVSTVDSNNYAEVEALIRPGASPTGRGGMSTKFTVARNLAQKGIDVYIANGKKPEAIAAALTGAASTRFATSV